MLITGTREPEAELGADVPVDVFTAEEALALLDGRTGLADEAGPRQWPPSSGICRWRWIRPRR